MNKEAYWQHKELRKRMEQTRRVRRSDCNKNADGRIEFHLDGSKNELREQIAKIFAQQKK